MVARSVTKDTEQDQATTENRSKKDQLTAVGLKEIEELARFHGFSSGLVGGRLVLSIGGGGDADSRVASTVNSFFRDNSFRPPSGVPVMLK